MQILFNQVIPSLFLSAFLAAGFSYVRQKLLAWSQALNDR